MSIERRRVLYGGRVQGVGFRFTAQRLAERFAVAGYVRNLPDGRVELVVEGEPSQLAALLDAVAREFQGYIRQAETTVLTPAQPPLDGFTIRY